MGTAIPNEKTVGSFTFKNGTITGPAQYLEDQGLALVKCIKAGKDPIFNMTCKRSSDIITAVLVRLQTDYTSWHEIRATILRLDPERNN